MAKDTTNTSAVSTKQKATIAALIIVVAIIIWQVMGLFESDTPAVRTAENTPPAAGTTATTTTTTVNTNAGNAPIRQQPSAEPQIKQAPVIVENKLLEDQKVMEGKYIEQLNQLQSLKLQREIAETNQAIASARLATVTAEKSVSDILTRPVTAIPQQPPNFSNLLPNLPQTAGPNPTEGPPSEELPPTPPPPPPPIPEVPYTVISVSMQLGQWNAIIGSQGKLYNVGVGDILPGENAVISISKTGVILKNSQGKERKINMLSTL